MNSGAISLPITFCSQDSKAQLKLDSVTHSISEGFEILVKREKVSNDEFFKIGEHNRNTLSSLKYIKYDSTVKIVVRKS